MRRTQKWLTFLSFAMAAALSTAAQGATPVCTAVVAAPASVETGDPLVLTATCNNGPTQYEWSRNGTVLATSASASYSTTAPSSAGSYTYAVRAKNDPTWSASVSVVVVVAEDDNDFVVNMIGALIPQCQTPVVAPLQAGQSLYTGQSATVSVTCTQTPANYVWSLNGTVLAGATTASITTTIPTGIATATFSVVANGRLPSRTVATSAIPVFTQQTITFGAQSSPRTFVANGTFAISPLATASSGLPVTYTTTTPAICTVSGTTVTMVVAGTCTIAANQAGNATYVAAPQVTQTIALINLPQTIIFGPQTSPRIFAAGGTFALSPLATASSGLAVTYTTATPAICTVSGTTVTMVSVGSCIIAANQIGDSTYTAAPEVTQTIILSNLQQQVISGFAPLATATYRAGTTIPLFAFGGASGNAVVFASQTPNICTVNGASLSVLAAGTCTVTANQAGNGSYSAASQVTASLNVLSSVHTDPVGTSSGIAGTTDGTFSVGGLGNAAYSIPIRMPPGTGGMVPSLSLNYDSSSSNGIVGVGWSIGGLGSIVRCAKTVAQDGVRGTVDLTSNDRFCLDGQRLMLSSGTSYGAASSEYRTELETFTKIVAQGSAGNGPQSFKATLRNGTVFEYGADAGSRMTLGGGQTPHAWLLTKVTDTKGNYYSVSYSVDTTTNTYLPSRIDFTGNALVSPALSTYNSVRFEYEARTDTEFAYINGIKVTTNKRLKYINTYAGESRVRSYSLSYDPNSTVTGRSRLLFLKECGTSDANCLPATDFAWTNDAIAFGGTEYSWPADGLERKQYIKWLDIDGDGKLDRCVAAGRLPFVNGRYVVHDLHCYLSSRNGGKADAASGQPPGGITIELGHFFKIQPADVNGDGLTDVCLSTSCWLSTGTGFSGRVDAPTVGSSVGSFSFDLNGDGRADVCKFSLDGDPNAVGTIVNVGFGCALSQGNTFEPTFLQLGNVTTCSDSNCVDNNAFNLVDVTGDGIPSFCQVEINNVAAPDRAAGKIRCKKLIFDSNGRPSGFASEWVSGTFPDIRGWKSAWVDFNGDGKKDYCTAAVTSGVLGSAKGFLRCILSSGTGFGDTIIANTSDESGLDLGYEPTYDWADVNGDGRADFCGTDSMGTARKCYHANANGFGPAVTGANFSLVAGELVDFDGDGLVDNCQNTFGMNVNSITKCKPASGSFPDLLTNITNGIGGVIGIEYKPLTNVSGGFYTKGSVNSSASTFPTVELIDSRRAVSKVSSSNGIGSGKNETTYQYKNARSNLQGRDFLGFETTIVNAPNGITTTVTRNQAFPLTGTTSSEVSKYGTTNIISDVTNTFSVEQLGSAGNFRHLVKPSATVVKTYDLDGSFQNWVETTISNYDSYANAESLSVVYKNASGVADGFSETTALTFQNNDMSNWVLGLPTSSIVTKKTPQDVNGKQRITRMDYYDSGQLKTVALEMASTTSTCADELCLKTVYEYDSFGNQTKKTVTGKAGLLTDRNEVRTVYDTKGRYPQTITNAEDHEETREYFESHGTLKSLTGPNSLTTSWTYDDFGRVLTESRPDSTSVTTTYQKCVSCFTDSAFVVSRETKSGSAFVSPPSYVFFDKLGREIIAATVGFGNAYSYVETWYDSLGRVNKTSLPYFDRDSITRYFHTTNDALGRPTLVTAPDNSSTTYIYSGRKTTVTDARASVKETVRNSQGQIEQITDAKGAGAQVESKVNYEYEPFGNLNKTTDQLGNVIQISHDVRGRKKTLVDPDLGTRSYEYDNLSQLMKQTDAKSQIQHFTYDKLGRKKSQISKNAAGAILDQNSTWDYDTDSAGNSCNKSKGKLCEARAQGGYVRKLTYDNFGRLSTSTTTPETGVTSMVSSWNYDSLGRLDTVTYPNSSGTATAYNFRMRYHYTDFGQLRMISDATAGKTPTAIWAASDKNADGNVLQETLGNGVVTKYTYDPSFGRLSTIKASLTGAAPFAIQDQQFTFDSLGNLAYRKDANVNTEENFGYDAQNRLTCANLKSTACVSTDTTLTSTVGYNAIGNITSRGGALSSAISGTYNYSASGAGSLRPHAVSGVTGTVNGVNNPSYSYDANGSLESGANRNASWTSFNMVKTLTFSGGTNTFSYGAEQQRTKKTWPSATSPTSTVYYLFDPHYEKEIKASITEHKHYITTGGGYGGRLVAVYTRKSDGSEDTKYIHTDHLNSTSVVTNSAGAVLERLAFDPWGDRRQANSAATADTSNTLIPATIDRGFTGHEGLDAGGMGLVQMNGRLYDPTLGRFLSADPMVAEPYRSQSFNRYAYVWNNPLSITDPSGFVPLPPYLPLAGQNGGVVSLPSIGVSGSRYDCGCKTVDPYELLTNANNERQVSESMGSRIARDLSSAVASAQAGVAALRQRVTKGFTLRTHYLPLFGLIALTVGSGTDGTPKEGESKDGEKALGEGESGKEGQIDQGKQNKHIAGTNENKTAGPDKSTWADPSDANELTRQAKENGSIDRVRSDGSMVIKWDPGKVVGNSGETQITVHVSPRGDFHGHPSGPRGK